MDPISNLTGRMDVRNFGFAMLLAEPKLIVTNFLDRGHVK